MSPLSTMPGTETKVMPEMDAPTMPKATMSHGLFLLPRKNASLPAWRDVTRLMARITRK